MAKESMKAREVKRAKLVAKYAEKRSLKEAEIGQPLISSPKTPVLAGFTIVVRSPVIPRVICVSSALVIQFREMASKGLIPSEES